MYYHDKRLQYPVRVEKPNPMFAKMLQQAIGGVEGELRVMLQYFFQAWGNRSPEKKYRDMLLETATEEISHVEMLATAVALNLENAPTAEQDAAASMSPMVNAIMAGMDPRQYLSAGLAALASDANGVPFDGSHIYASGNLAADMYANITAEATGRALATRLYNITDDPGMKDMFSFLIARDTMHQQQWAAVLEELEGRGGVFPIPNSFNQSYENQEFSYLFAGTDKDPSTPIPRGRWTEGPSIDGKGQFTARQLEPQGEEPQLAPPPPEAFAQVQQMSEEHKGLFDKVKEKIT
ncbi:MAG: manganese catalase family protein [Pseudomonadota bacterium]|nr:manganese catalase family protein [Pseudomonadota bacterium]